VNIDLDLEVDMVRLQLLAKEDEANRVGKHDSYYNTDFAILAMRLAMPMIKRITELSTLVQQLEDRLDSL